MNSPSLRILGVYKLEVTPEMFAEQLQMYGDEARGRDHFSSVVLIEALVDAAGKPLNLAKFTQPNPAYPHNSSQVPWDEALLSADAETLTARRIGCVKGDGLLRFAFYIHYWNPRLPLQWTYGEVNCPQPQAMPVRLQMLMPYRPCD